MGERQKSEWWKGEVKKAKDGRRRRVECASLVGCAKACVNGVLSVISRWTLMSRKGRLVIFLMHAVTL